MKNKIIVCLLFIINGHLTPSLSRSIFVNNYFGLSAGYDIAGVLVPSVGYYYDFKSSDDKSLNYSAVGYSLQMNIPLNENRSGIYIKGFYAANQFQLTAGIHAVIF